ncbi:U11/U12 small nuclear ribonucleoprotein 48 kDa protein [Impatiens glandulifera]|uniref:U11/U12 small nuclear ribonucleoprotein 48 kDa protein n=1 Tax=Impatiens glandulifera TaxID=253017 RepID=UPI001FB051AA|nr:U11/U12 small nuclear ribonucleoprotein 48 kDa protein [Impatiens glandulifera]
MDAVPFTMNPSTPFPSPPFSFPPSNPNPNPNSYPSFHPFPPPQYYHHHHHHASTFISSTAPPPPPPDLTSSLASLKEVIRLAESTVDSISSFLGTANVATADDNLSTCPFNPHHLVPPESLFRHSLQCPSSSAVLDLELLGSFRYHETLQSSDELTKQRSFVQELPPSNADLCFSFDDYGNFSNFFYRDCPGVVSSIHDGSSDRTFTLPRVLSAECANFFGSEEMDARSLFGGDCFSLLPSELCLIRRETENWNNYPSFYSYSMLRVLLCSGMANEQKFSRWVIMNSPRYGVVIDAPMRDHVVLLFKLCLKAIVREADGSAALLFDSEQKHLHTATMSFKCPILAGVMTWLGYQLSVLYGEINGKLYSANMLKQWVLDISLGLLVFPALQRLKSSQMDKSEKRSLEILEDKIDNVSILNKESIFVSQIAAAIAALFELSLFDKKVKALRTSGGISTRERMAEHAFLSQRADEERKRRPNYKPVIEHDGLLWKRHNQDTNKLKTREELLAEERDYKRRRMSYRGKKMKRTTTQVMRDIIEEYMGEIKQTGGIGCSKGTVEEKVSYNSISTNNNLPEQKENSRRSSEVTDEAADGDRNSLKLEDKERFRGRARDEYSEAEHRERRGRDSSSYYDHKERKRDRDRDRDRDKNESSHDVLHSRKRSQSRERYKHGKHERSSRQKDERVHHTSKTDDRSRRHSYKDRRLDYDVNEFEDRYNPI